jgi:hypothetical protein
MSLIEEALRKQQQEAAQTETPTRTGAPTADGPAKTPPGPPPLPAGLAAAAAPAAPQETPTPRRWPVVLGIVAVLALLAGGGLALSTVVKEKWSGAKAQVLSQLPTVAKGRLRTNTTKVVSPASNVSLATTMVVVAVSNGPSHASPPGASATVRVNIASAPSLPVPSMTTNPTPVPSVQPLTSAVPVQAKIAVLWPKLRLGGVLSAGAAEQGSAILNSRVVGQGQSISGVTVVSVSRDGVEIEFQGERRYLKTGESTE